MNRAERRRKIRQLNTPAKIDNFGRELEYRIRKEYAEEQDRRIKFFIEHYTIMTAYVLNYKLGLGKKRLPKIMKEIMRHVEMIDEGYLSLEDCENELKRVGIEFNFDKKED